MKENLELQRVNYSLQKHHREMLHQQINPRVIQKIEVANNPSLNYRKAFESVYHDELERTLQYQEQKQQERSSASKYAVNLPQITHSSSHQSLQMARQNGKVSESRYKNNFTDYDEERGRKFDDLINKGLDGGKSFFRSQEEYQKKKQFESNLTNATLKQQLVINRDKKTLSKQKENYDNEVIRQNRVRQLEMEKVRQFQKKQEQQNLGLEIQHQIQADEMKRSQKPYYELSQIGRHNPITNPIEYHIDNPYILKRFQENVPGK